MPKQKKAKEPCTDGRRFNKGAPRVVLSEQQLEAAIELASLGFAEYEIAEVLGINEATYHAIKKRDERLGMAVRRGRIEADASVVQALHQKALAGDTTAMIFYLKNRRPDEWRDKQQVAHEGEIKGGTAPIILNILPVSAGKEAQPKEPDAK